MGAGDALDRHAELIRGLSSAGVLGLDAPTATIRNPRWFYTNPSGQSVETRERGFLHDRLLAHRLAAFRNAANGLRALVFAGPPGAGKGWVQANEFDLSGFVVIDPDEFKALLLREAIRDGSYESWIKPAAVKDLGAQGERFAPMELAALVHEESSILAERMRREAMAAGRNLVADSVLSDQAKAIRLGRLLEASGYRITVLDVEVPYFVSEASIRQRYRDGYERAMAGEDALGGRWVPSEYARSVFNGPGEPSKPELAARELAEQCPVVMEYRLYRGMEVGGPRELETRLVRQRPGAPLLAADRAAGLSAARRNQTGSVVE